MAKMFYTAREVKKIEEDQASALKTYQNHCLALLTENEHLSLRLQYAMVHLLTPKQRDELTAKFAEYPSFEPSANIIELVGEKPKKEKKKIVEGE